MSDVRDRMAVAMVDVVCDHGHEGATVALVCERAGITEAEFARRYAGLAEAALDIYWKYTDDFTAGLLAAFGAHEVWRDSLRAAAYFAARYSRDNPKVIRFGTTLMFASGQMSQVERESHLHRMVDLIDAGRGEPGAPDSLTRTTAEATFGAIYESLVRAAHGEGTGSAEDHVPRLMYIAVRPYLGEEAAREELEIPAPPEHRASVAG